MKIKISKKIKINFNNKTLLLIFVLLVISMISALLFFGYDLSQKPGIAQEIKRDTSLEIDTNKIETVDEYKNIEIPIDLNQGIGKTEPF